MSPSFSRTARLFVAIIVVLYAGESPAIKAQEAKDEVQMPIDGKIGEWAIGAGGARLAIRSAEGLELCVVDVAKGTILGKAPPVFPNEPCILSADEDSFYVLCPKARELRRFDLETLRELAVTKFPGVDAEPVSVASGSSAKGSVAVAYLRERSGERSKAFVQMLERETLQPEKGEAPRETDADLAPPVTGYASADGASVVFYSPPSERACEVLTREGEGWKTRAYSDNSLTFTDEMILTADGRRIVSSWGTRDLVHPAFGRSATWTRHEVPPRRVRGRAFPMPAFDVSGSLSVFYDSEKLRLNAPFERGTSVEGTVGIGFVPDGEYFETQEARGFDLYDGARPSPDAASPRDLRQRIFYSNRAKRIAVIPFSNARVVLRKFDAEAVVGPTPNGAPLTMQGTTGSDAGASASALKDPRKGAEGSTAYVSAPASDEVHVTVEGKIREWAIGAGGSRLAVRTARGSDVAVIDVENGTILCSAESMYPDKDCRLAADEDSLYVLCRQKRELRRYELDTLRELAVTAFPGIDLDAAALAVGPSARGIVAVAMFRHRSGKSSESFVQLLDRETLRPLADEGPRKTKANLEMPIGSYASANGDSIVFYRRGPMQGCELFARDGEAWNSRLLHEAFSDEALFSDDGRWLIEERGMYDLSPTPDGSDPPLTLRANRSGGPVHRRLFPLQAFGVSGSLSAYFESKALQRKKPVDVDLSTAGQVTIGYVPENAYHETREAKGFDLYNGINPQSVNPHQSELELRKRIYYSHRAKRIVVMPYSDDLVVLRKFDVEGADDPTRKAAEGLAVRRLEGGKAKIMRGSPDDEVLALTGDRKLLRFADDGATVASATPLEFDYDVVGRRGDHLVAVSGARRKIDVLQASDGKILRSADFPSHECFDLAMHPTRPLSYISYLDDENQTKSSFLVFDEVEAAVVKARAPLPGRSLDVAPNGSKLLVGAELVSNTRVRTVTLGAFGPIVTEFNPAVRIALDYDLFDPKNPVPERADVVDGKVDRTICAPDSSTVAFLAKRPDLTLRLLRTSNLQPTPERTFEELPWQGGSDRLGSDVAWHPTLDVVAALFGGSVSIHAAHDSSQAKEVVKVIAGSLTQDLGSEFAERLWFSRDGKNLVVLCQRDEGSFLHIFPIKLPTRASALIAMGFGARPAGRNARVPLEQFHALRGGGEPMEVRDVAKTFAPSVVVVQSGDSRGSGFVVSARGYALTCAHVLEPGEEVRVLFMNPDRPGIAAASVAATIVEQDHALDIALLRYSPPVDSTPIRLSTDTNVAAGESVTVIGNPGVGPETLEQTVTTGVVSSASRTLGERALIQISAAINPGSSGGPAFDDRGRVIGMVTRKGAIEGAGFAISAVELTDFLLRNALLDDGSLGLERIWTERDRGRALTAELASIGDSVVTVRDAKRDKSFEIPFERLSEDDVRFLEAISALRQSRAEGR